MHNMSQEVRVRQNMAQEVMARVMHNMSQEVMGHAQHGTRGKGHAQHVTRGKSCRDVVLYYNINRKISGRDRDWLASCS